jgi:hypothetical protein
LWQRNVKSAAERPPLRQVVAEPPPLSSKVGGGALSWRRSRRSSHQQQWRRRRSTPHELRWWRPSAMEAAAELPFGSGGHTRSHQSPNITQRHTHFSHNTLCHSMSLRVTPGHCGSHQVTPGQATTTRPQVTPQVISRSLAGHSQVTPALTRSPPAPGHTSSPQFVPALPSSPPRSRQVTPGFHILLGHTRPHPLTPGHTRSLQVVTGHTRSHQLTPGNTE